MNRQRLTTWVIFLFVVFAFTINSIRTEVQQDTMERTLAVECHTRNEGATRLNTVLDGIMHAVEQDKDLPAAEKTKRMTFYAGAKADLVDCDHNGVAP